MTNEKTKTKTVQEELMRENKPENIHEWLREQNRQPADIHEFVKMQNQSNQKGEKTNESTKIN
jgi:flagellar biosynthesis protein FliP